MNPPLRGPAAYFPAESGAMRVLMFPRLPDWPGHHKVAPALDLDDVVEVIQSSTPLQFQISACNYHPGPLHLPGGKRRGAFKIYIYWEISPQASEG